MTAINEDFNIENIIFKYIDEFKFIFFPDKWSSVFLDYSKNEILAMLLIYRKNKVNMSEIAEYINAPLNTATGVISRLEKKNIAERTRDNEDKRVVMITLTENGREFILEEKRQIEYYFKEVYKSLTKEEINAAMSIVNKVVAVLKAGNQKKMQEEKVVKKIRRITIE
ncbi:MarR family transcriptional regulator [Clostridium sp.]|uniref:MarR family transcriptional regulator n=1 Tax=Clostridium sp. TaxID=1506 RepID=UPI002607E606|nr:MarR family transcriptional regulator [Clostridium sp.]